MPVSKNAMARYHRLDACLKDRNNKYYIEDLIRECFLARVRKILERNE